jgi:spermidine synthase
MLHPTQVRRLVLLAVFTASGFAGLIYESLWAHYIKLLLGHAAYAQTLVLVVYMGGLSAGAWLASRSDRWRDPLRAYGLTELAIGASALVFHALFVSLDAWLHASVLPGLTPGSAQLARWTLATLLMLPQAVLLGMTFPLMSAAVLRLAPERAGATIGMLYFTNCIGAAVGVLVGAFLLVPALGLPGALTVAGAANLGVAALALLLARGTAPAAALTPTATGGPVARAILLAAALTGFASFIYEIVWVRLLSLVLGSTMQAFELMLSAFITGLAFGGLWVRHRADSVADPLRLAGWVQIAMGVLAAGTLLIYAASFEWMGWLLRSVARTDGGYTLFTLAGHGIALAVMLPATFMAGMTLPLFTTAALRAGAGERAVGRVYALNTLGCIAGAVVAVWLLLPFLGTHRALYLGAIIDVGLGLWLLRRSGVGRRSLGLAVILGAGLLALVMLTYHHDTRRLASGVYRYARTSLSADTEVLYHRDGRTATIDLYREKGGNLVIATNGKPDAAFDPAGTVLQTDVSTMTSIAAIALGLRPEAQEAAVIGFGSGMSTDVLLAWPGLSAVHTIEIEPAMVEAARGFGAPVARAYLDPRSRLHIDDAKAFFAVRQQRFDIVVSEPSNPWVSGVGNLFSLEFYTRLRQHLTPDGVLVQWLQLYEADEDLVASVYRALAPAFRNVEVFLPNDHDLMFVASDGPLTLSAAPWSDPTLAALLATRGLPRPADLAARRLADQQSLPALFAASTAPANSDYAPYLSIHGPRARHRTRSAASLGAALGIDVPVTRWLHRDPRPATIISVAGTAAWTARGPDAARSAAALLDSAAPRTGLTRREQWAIDLLRAELAACAAGSPRVADRAVREALDTLGPVIATHLPTADQASVWAQFTPRCTAAWQARTQRSLALHQAVGRDDLAAASALGRELLAETTGATTRERLLVTALAADLGRGDRAAALSLWRAEGAELAGRRPAARTLAWLGAIAQGPAPAPGP